MHTQIKLAALCCGDPFIIFTEAWICVFNRVLLVVPVVASFAWDNPFHSFAMAFFFHLCFLWANLVFYIIFSIYTHFLRSFYYYFVSVHDALWGCVSHNSIVRPCLSFTCQCMQNTNNVSVHHHTPLYLSLFLLLTVVNCVGRSKKTPSSMKIKKSDFTTLICAFFCYEIFMTKNYFDLCVWLVCLITWMELMPAACK